MLSMFAARQGFVHLGTVIALVLFAAILAWLPTTTALVLIGGVFLCLALPRYPELAIYLLIFAIPFGSLMPLPVGGANVTAADGLLLLTFALWLARQIARRQIILRRASLLIPFFVFIFAVSLSLTVALSFHSAVKEWLKWLEMLAVYWLITQDFEPPQIQRALVAILCAGTAEAAVGIYQYVFRIGPEGFVFLGTSPRAFGTFEQPNPFAGYLGLISPLAFGVVLGILFDKAKSLSRYAWLMVAVAALGVMSAALFYSLSRGAWLGVGAGLVVTAIIRSKRAAAFSLMLALLIAVTALLGQLNLIPGAVTERFSGVADYFSIQDVRGIKTTDANFAIIERMAHWQAAWQMFESHPWLGVGIGNYAAAYPAYALPHWDEPLGHAHNYYLNIAAESGLIGLCAYLFLWGAIFWMAWRVVRTTRGWAQGVAAGAVGVLVALSIHNLFDNLFVHSMQMQVGVTLGLLETIKRVG